MSAFVSGLALVLVLATPSQAQDRLIGECEDCVGRLRVIVTLGDEAGSGYLGMPHAVLKRGDGSFLVGDYASPGELKVFDSGGAFLRPVGREGEGPGEFTSVGPMRLLPGDSVEVADFGLLRISVLGPSLEFVRSRQVQAPLRHIAVLPGDTLVVVGQFPNALGLPLHTVSPEGERWRSYGSDPPVADIRNRDLMARNIAASNRGGVWAAHRIDYRIDRWSSGGEKLESLVRVVDWLPEGQTERKGPVPGHVPDPLVVALAEDEAGLLWVVSRVADPSWHTAFEMIETPWGEERPGVRRWSEYYDSIVEAIDVARGIVVYRARTDLALYGFAGDRLFYAYRENALGVPFIDLVVPEGF